MTNVEVECTDSQLEMFLERVLILQRYQTVDDENATTDVGIVSLFTVVSQKKPTIYGLSANPSVLPQFPSEV